jgi:D-alanyl-D-alanine carboxypeptidase/D-alanyl-D-alanine-endopeptidase (penicillin-binding protein 4)
VAGLLLACLAAAPALAADASLQEQARTLLGAGQGVYVQAADGTVLVEQAADRAVHPASISKIPTTLALLGGYGPDYRFTTTLRADGPLHAGVLASDLWVEGGADPFLVDESALRIVQALQARGIVRIAGALRASGTLAFDWQRDGAAQRLRHALCGGASAEAWMRLQPDPAALPLPLMPALAIDGPAMESERADLGAGGTAPGPASRPATAVPQPTDLPPVLLMYRSPPLLHIAKALNDYSNNVFAPLAEAAGGAAAVQAVARAAVPPAMREEITLGDGAGADPANRLSPRATVALLRALEATLARSGHALVDALPVSGLDRGTLEKRLDGEGEAGHVVGKTGTYGEYGASALAGALRTREYGTVYFAILNHGVPVPVARKRQEAFVRALLARWQTEAWPYQRAAVEPWAEAAIEFPSTPGAPPVPALAPDGAAP